MTKSELIEQITKALNRDANQYELEYLVNEYFRKDELPKDICDIVLNCVSKHFFIKREQIIQKVRKRHIVDARRTAVYVMRNYNVPYERIGVALNFHHASAINMFNGALDLKETYTPFSNSLNEVLKMVKQELNK